MRFLIVVLCALALCAFSPRASLAKDGKYALIIGNAAYNHAPVLRNPGRDSRAMRSALQKLGFDVEFGQDLTWAQTQQIVSSFLSKATSAKTALFFYAGHGIQIGGQNFIIPTDANFLEPGDLDRKIVSMNDIFRHIDKRSETGLVFLDACRDNPFRKQIQAKLTSGQAQLSRSMGHIRLKRGLARVEAGTEAAGNDVVSADTPGTLGNQPLAMGSLGIGPGLAEIDGGEGMFVAYATRPGRVALDGSGRHSPFTEGLLRYINKPGLEIRQVLTRVRKHVRQKTKDQQTPWDSSSLVDDFYLAALPPDSAVVPSRPQSSKTRKNRLLKKNDRNRVRTKKRHSRVKTTKKSSQKERRASTSKNRPKKKRQRMFLP